MNRAAMLAGVALAAIAMVSAWFLLAGEEHVTPAAEREVALESRSASAPESSPETTPAANATARSETAPVTVRDDAREPAASSATEASAAEWRLAVFTEADAAVRGATVAVLEASGATWDANTDEDGAVRAPEADGEAQVFVAAAGRPLERFLISRAAGGHSVRLSQAFTQLAGIVTVGGVAPHAPLTVFFEPRPAPFAELELPEALRRKLDVAARRSAATDEAGRFAVDGVPLDWSGNAVAPRGHAVRRRDPNESPQRRIAIERPSTALVLEFERLPHLVGRFVDEAGAPAPAGSTLRAAIHNPGGRSISSSTTPLDADGRFEIALREARVQSVELALECDSGQLKQTFSGEELRLDARGDLDAGTLVLSPRTPLRLRVLDWEGVALSKAKARVVGDSDWSETDSSGECVVKTAAAGASTVRVVARGFSEERLSLQLPMDEVVEVRMRRANRLELELVDAMNAPLRHVLVRVESTGEPLFRASNAWYPDGESHELLRGTFAGGGEDVREPRRGWFDAQPTEGGQIAVEGLSPRAALKVSVLDQLGQLLLERDLAALGEAEQRVERLRIDTPLLQLTGRVTDTLGQPIGGANLQLASPEPYGDPLSTRSDSSGRYTFRGLSGARVRLQVGAEGFVARTQLDVELRAPVNQFDLVLEKR